MLVFYLSLIDDEVSRSQFEEFYERYRHIMLHVALSVLHDRSLAEDAVHDAFLRIIKSTKFSFDNLYGLECHKRQAFFVIVVRNTAIDLLRQRFRNAEIPLPEYGDILRSEDKMPDQMAIDHETSTNLLEAVKRMNPAYRDALILHIVYGFSGREVASMLGASEVTIRTRIHRGKKQLYSIMEGDEHVVHSRKGSATEPDPE